MKMAMVAAVAVMALTGVADTVPWINLDDVHKLGGRKITDGYLRGKVVLVCRDAKFAERMEEIWTSFKTKQFVLLGSYAEKAEDCTYPMYAESGMAEAPEGVPLYVVDETGHLYYKGNDERNATQALVMALTDTDSPKTVKQLQKFLDWEIMETPGAAMNRFAEFKKRFPQEAKAYAEKEKSLKEVADVKKLAELVAFAKRAKDMREFDPKKHQMKKSQFAAKLKNALSKYKGLKESIDQRVVQEAKNALADITWKLAEVQ